MQLVWLFFFFFFFFLPWILVWFLEERMMHWQPQLISQPAGMVEGLKDIESFKSLATCCPGLRPHTAYCLLRVKIEPYLCKPQKIEGVFLFCFCFQQKPKICLIAIPCGEMVNTQGRGRSLALGKYRNSQVKKLKESSGILLEAKWLFRYTAKNQISKAFKKTSMVGKVGNGN